MKKKIIALILSLMMVIGLFPADVSAKEADTISATSEDVYLYGEEAVVTSSVIGKPQANYFFPSDAGDVFYYVEEKEYVNSWGYTEIGSVIKSYDINTGEVKTVFSPEGSMSDIYYRSGKLYYIYGGNICVLNLTTGTASKVFSLSDGGSSLVVDGKGRFFVSSGNSIYVYNSTGSLIAKGENATSISELFDVDDRNGNIYFRGYYNWIYWGYDHSMSALKIARLNSDNTITFGANDNPITIFYQNYWYDHVCSAEMLGGKYLADLSTFSSDTLFILDSQIPSPKQVTESSTTISLMDSSVSVSGVNLSREDAVVAAVKTKASVYDNSDDDGSVGTRCAYLNSNGKNRLFVISDDKVITEYSLDSKSQTGTINAKASVYKIMTVGDKLVLVERDADTYSVEVLSVELPTKLTVSGKTSLKVGDTADYKASFDTSMTPDTTFSSSDSSILTIDEDGSASAWSAGTVTVLAKGGGLTGKLTVKVEAGNAAAAGGVIDAGGTVTSNINKNNYSTWYAPVTSYLEEIDDNTLMRVEKNSDETVLVEYMDRAGKVSSRQTIAKELSFFAGFYKGKTYNFLVFGQNNESESDDTEVLRVVRYDKNWKRNGAAHISGVNTFHPVDAGTLRMAENDGVLYIHTCHEMYQSSDGYHHQANMTFEVKESDMSIKDSYSDVMNTSTGYVSHSFNQFIRIYNGNVYRVDHGEGYPTGVAFTMYPVSGKMSSPTRYGTLVQFSGYGNYTGASIGGFELSRTHAIVAYNQDIDSDSYYSKRNVKVVTVSHVTGSINKRDITSYTEADGITCLTPQLVKLTDGHFVLMWTEKNSDVGTSNVAYVKLDAAGNPMGRVIRKNWSLSDCQPILLSDGTVAWYVTDGSGMKLYNVDFLNSTFVEDIVLNKKTLSVGIGASERIEASVKPATATNKKVIWTSSNPSVALVDGTGLVAGVSAGTATITAMSAEDSAIFAEMTVNVLKTPAQLSITLVQPTMVYTGSALKPAVTIKDSVYLLKEGKDYTLSYKNNTDIGTGIVTITGKGNYTGSLDKTFAITKDKTPGIDIMYRTYVQSYGWQGWVKDGTTSGTTAAAKRMEGLQVKLTKKDASGSIEYRSYVQTYGWRPWVANGALSGTKGEAKRVESLQIRLKGNIRNNYDLYYRVYSQGYGWLGWAKNGATAGTAGYAKRIEAIQILPVAKGGKAPTGTKSAYVKKQ